MSSSRHNLSEAEWNRHKGEIRKCYVKKRCKLKELVAYFNDLNLDVTESQVSYKLKLWNFRQNASRQAWKFAGHIISKRTRDGKKSEVMLSGVRLEPSTIRKETMRYRSLPKLRQHSPSPEPPSNLPLAVCSPAPIEVTFDWPQGLPWLEFQTRLCQLSMIPPATQWNQTDIVDQLIYALRHDGNSFLLGVSKDWSPQNLPTIAAYMGLAIPQTLEEDNIARAELLVSGSGPERLRVILEVFIAKLSNDMVPWEQIECNWSLLKAAFEYLFSFAPGIQLLQTQTMLALSDNLFMQALRALTDPFIFQGASERHDAEVALQVMNWLLQAGYKRIHAPLLRVVEFGDMLQDAARLLVAHGADMCHLGHYAFSTLQLVLDEEVMRCTGRCPNTSALRRIFIDKAINTPNLNRQCAAQYYGSIPQESWTAWFGYILHMMAPTGLDLLQGWPPENFIDPMISAAGAGNNDAIEFFLAQGSSLNSENALDIFPLLAAVARKQIHTCSYLIGLGADVNKRGPGGLLAMHVAAMTGDIDILRLMVESTVDKSLFVITENCQSRAENVILRLLPTNDGIDCPKGAYTTLDIAMSEKFGKPIPFSRHDKIECIKYLLKGGFTSLSDDTITEYLFADYRPTGFHHLDEWLKDGELLDILIDAGRNIFLRHDRPYEHCNWIAKILRAAISYHHATLVTKLLREGAKLDGDEVGLALETGNIHAAEALLEAGAELRKKSKSGKSFLEMAIFGGHEGVIHWALAASPELYDPGALCAAVYLALRTNDQAWCQIILERRPETPTANLLESTAVAIAADGSNIELLQLLLSVIPQSDACLLGGYQYFEASCPRHNSDSPDHSCRIANEKVYRYYRRYVCGSPLTCAIGPEKDKILSLMIRRGYRPDLTTLLKAIMVGNLEQTKQILDGDLGGMINDNSALYNSWTCVFIAHDLPSPIQLAASLNETEIVRYLVVHMNDRPDEWQENEHLNYSPLQYAVEHGNLEMLAILLEAGAQPNGKPAVQCGSTALQIAAQKGYITIAKILLDHSCPADVNAHRAPIEGMTALEAAAQYGRIDMVKYLLCKGAKTEGTGHRQYIQSIRFAIEQDHHEIVKILRSCREWTERDEQRLQNDDGWGFLCEYDVFKEDTHTSVHDSECSDTECSFVHRCTCNTGSDRGEDSETDSADKALDADDIAGGSHDTSGRAWDGMGTEELEEASIDWGAWIDWEPETT
ncbi:ankyrin repeat-containing domain protein [Astrocystis sublimbata]|nr:ankyrin repeat-containing domain protein [Astrocystis sublimbata]